MNTNERNDFYKDRFPFISKNDNGLCLKFFDKSDFEQVPKASPIYDQIKEYFMSRKSWLIIEHNNNIIGFVGLDRKGESGIYIHPMIRPTDDMLIYVLELFSSALLARGERERVEIFPDRLKGICNDPIYVIESAGFILTGQPMRILNAYTSPIYSRFRDFL